MPEKFANRWGIAVLIGDAIAIIMAWWPLASASHALATGFRPLAASRFLLGMGEGFGEGHGAAYLNRFL